MFDKTGTLTEGVPQVVKAQLLQGDAISLVLALTTTSKHPISKAVASYLAASYPASVPSIIDGLKSIPGSGIEGRYGGKLLRGGNPTWLDLDSNVNVTELKSQRLTLFAATFDGKPIAIFGLEDGIRASALETVNLLQRRGIEIHIVSGDEPQVVSALAERLGIPSNNAVGGYKPQSKLEYVKKLQTRLVNPYSRRDRKSPARRVAFFGDGTNDSLALVQADIGISFGSGTDVAMSAADVVFMDAQNLERSVRTMLDISEGAVLRIQVCDLRLKRKVTIF